LAGLLQDEASESYVYRVTVQSKHTYIIAGTPRVVTFFF